MSLFKTPKLESLDEQVLARVLELGKELAHLTAITPRRWHGVLRRNTFALAIQGSNSIEGYHVTVDDAIAAVEGEEPMDPKSEAWAAVNGYRMAMTLVLQMAEAPRFRFSNEVLNSLHFMMTGYDLTKHPGNWRPGNIFVHNDASGEVVHEGPPRERIEGLMDELIDQLNAPSKDDPVIRAAMAHLDLVMIHPWSDGNGRMARCLQTLVLARTGVMHPIFASIEEYLGRNTADYYRVLGEVGGGSWQPARSARAWIRFCLTAHFRQATTLLRRSQQIQALCDLFEKEIQLRKLPDRTMWAVVDAAMGFKVRNGTYRKTVDVSVKNALRDLRELVEAGFLDPQGEKRGRYYVATELTKKLGKRVGRPAPVPDPYQLIAERGPLIPGTEEYLLR